MMQHLADISQFESLANQAFVPVNNGFGRDLVTSIHTKLPSALSSTKPPLSDPSSSVANMVHIISDSFNSAWTHMQSFLSSLPPAEVAIMSGGMGLAMAFVAKYMSDQMARSAQKRDLDNMISRLPDGLPMDEDEDEEENISPELDSDSGLDTDEEGDLGTTLGSVPTEEQVYGPAEKPVGSRIIDDKEGISDAKVS